MSTPVDLSGSAGHVAVVGGGVAQHPDAGARLGDACDVGPCAAVRDQRIEAVVTCGSAGEGEGAGGRSSVPYR